jgi:hypothetical protein
MQRVLTLGQNVKDVSAFPKPSTELFGRLCQHDVGNVLANVDWMYVLPPIFVSTGYAALPANKT